MNLKAEPLPHCPVDSTKLTENHILSNDQTGRSWGYTREENPIFLLQKITLIIKLVLTLCKIRFAGRKGRTCQILVWAVPSVTLNKWGQHILKENKYISSQKLWQLLPWTFNQIYCQSLWLFCHLRGRSSVYNPDKSRRIKRHTRSCWTFLHAAVPETLISV